MAGAREVICGLNRQFISEPGHRDRDDDEGHAVDNPLQVADVHAEHVIQIGDHDDVAGAARRRARAADVAGHGDGDHQELGKLGVLRDFAGQAVLVEQDADGQEHRRQGMVGNESRHRGDDDE